MYRPTVRYDEAFRNYVDSLFHATHLDRNQIIRGALFAAAHSKEFADLLTIYKKPGVSLPSPVWNIRQHGYWMDQRYQPEEGGKDVNATKTRQQGPISTEPIRITNAGGISFSL
ncbi:hypothetical protein [Metabacillus sp. Hm71]|uniref:hypothetical protein n=1 Tax=Metabacillus sp. Hm71 TaxID=3450743 RepID=UPI003F43C829